jgi:hypothetical protein
LSRGSQDTGAPAVTILMHCSGNEAKGAIEQIFGTPFSLDHTDTWRTLPTAVEDIYRQCKPLRATYTMRANDG